jgi:hypothetical protein
VETSTQGWIEAVKQGFADYAGGADTPSAAFLLRIMELSECDSMPPPTVWVNGGGWLSVTWRFQLPKTSRWISIETNGDGFMYYRMVGKADSLRKKCESGAVDGFRMLIGWARGEKDR